MADAHSASRGGTPTRRQKASIFSIRTSTASPSGVAAGVERGRASVANSACRTWRLIRNAAGSIMAQAMPCGTRQWMPRAAATPWARPSPELASAMPESKAACDIRSRAVREPPFSTASAIAGTAAEPLHCQRLGIGWAFREM